MIAEIISQIRHLTALAKSKGFEYDCAYVNFGSGLYVKAALYFDGRRKEKLANYECDNAVIDKKGWEEHYNKVVSLVTMK